jgi:hypothetical protein
MFAANCFNSIVNHQNCYKTVNKSTIQNQNDQKSLLRVSISGCTNLEWAVGRWMGPSCMHLAGARKEGEALDIT